MALAAGDIAEAKADYMQALAVTRRLAALDPSDVELQRDLMVSLQQLGDRPQGQGDAAGALADYRQGIGQVPDLGCGAPGRPVATTSPRAPENGADHGSA